MHDYRTALVTGASSGIGRAVAVALAERGLRVHALARRRALLESLVAETGCQALAVDLGDAQAVEKALAPLEVDVLVNAAGMAVGYHAAHEQPRIEDFDVMVDVNLTAVLRLLRLAVPGMVARNRGHVVNIGSTFGLHPVANSTTYAAVKGAIHQLSQSLRADLLGRRVRVSEICPGRVVTGFHTTALAGDALRARQVFYEGRESLAPEDVVAAILYALEAPLHVNVAMIELTPLMQGPTGIAFVDALEG